MRDAEPSQTEQKGQKGPEARREPGHHAVDLLDGAPGAPRCRIYFDVIEELLFAADWRDEPCCAALTGRCWSDDGPGDGSDARRRVEVTGFSGLSYAGVASALLECGKTALQRVVPDSEGQQNHRRADRRAGGVGLFVSVPGSGARLDSGLARLHMSVLNGPSRLLVVTDPRARKLAVYSRSPGERFERAAVSVVYESEAASRQADDENDELSNLTGDVTDPTGVDDGDADAESADERPDRRDRGPGDSG